MQDEIKTNKWIEIDIDAIVNNLRQVQQHLADEVRLIAVLKANAYGHGLQETANILVNQGVDFLAVTFLEEAMALRQAGITCSILLLSPLYTIEQMATAFNHNITVSINSTDEAENIQALARGSDTFSVHIKTDTGLGRFGSNLENILEICNILQKNPSIYIEGVYTHMAEAASDQAGYTLKQFDQFMSIIAFLEQNNIFIPIKHCANSAVFLKYPHMHLNAVRIGTLLSGQHPVGSFSTVLELKDPFLFKTRIISLRCLKAGSYLGYNRTYRLHKPALVAVIPVGFVDGLVLEVANTPAGLLDLIKIAVKYGLRYFNVEKYVPSVIIKGQSCPIRGKVFMQLALVEIPSGLTDIKIGDEVTVPVRKTLTSRQTTRVYTKAGKIGKIMNDDKITYCVTGQSKEEEEPADGPDQGSAEQ